MSTLYQEYPTTDAKQAIGATSYETSSLSSSDFRSAIRGILFFGVPKNAQEAFGNLADLAGQGASEADSELIKTLRRDVSWLQDTNSRYSTVRHVFKEVYFVESAGEVCEDNGANQQVCPFTSIPFLLMGC